MNLRARLRRLGRALTTSAALLTIAALVLALLVWFVGPLIAFGELRPLGPASTRLAVLLVIVLAWGVAGYFIRVRRASEDQALLAALRRQQEEAQQAEDAGKAAAEAQFAAFREAARGAMRLARGGRFGLFGGDRYRLPWYLLLGAEGAGKTAIVLNSGLVLPYRAEDAPGVAADFHLADQAVLVEIDGRFLEQSEQPVTALWLRMLDHLRRLRPQQPANGIIVAVSAGELMAMTPEALLDFSSTVRRRLDEAASRLRTRAPIYLVVTKLDLLVGFEEFFEAMSADERAMVLGLPLDGAGAAGGTSAERFAQGFADLVERLSDQLLFRLQEEPDMERRRRLFEFPSHFAAMRAALEPFVAYIAAQHRFDAAPQVRGLFFASATQAGPSVDALTPQLAGSFAQQPRNLALRHDGAQTRGRPYFLRGLIRDVVVPEASLGGLTRPAAMVVRARGIAANVLLTVAAFALIALWWLSFSEGRAYTARLADGIEEARASIAAAAPEGQAAPGFEPVLGVLDDLRALAQERPQRAAFGLYGTASVERAARETYDRAVGGMLLPYVWRYLRDDIADPQVAAATRFHQLKLYLMLVGERPVEPQAAALLGPDFSARWLPYDRSEEIDAKVSGHMAELASIEMPPLLHDLPLVDRSRALISDYTLARLAYDTLSALPEVRQLPVWRPVDHMGLTGPQALARVSGASLWDGIAGLYTNDGFFGTGLPATGTVANALAADLWVMGVPDGRAEREREAQRIRDGMLDLYRVDYIRVWDSLLSDLAMAEGADAGEVARAMALIIGNPSPVKELTAAIAAETDLSARQGALGALTGAVSDQAGRIAGSVLAPQRVVDVGAAVSEHFRTFREAVVAAEGQQAKIDAMLAGLEPLYRQINHVATGGDVLELGTEPQTVLGQLGEQAAALPETLQPLFRRILAQAAAVTGGSSRERLSQIWSTTVLPACQATTDGRYPFEPRSGDDASIADFASVFGPTGLIAGFRNDYLRPFIDTAASPWRWRPGQQAGPGFGGEVLAAFELADRITTAYFGDSETPSVEFTVEPVRLDAKARAFQFDIGGPTLVYTHGPPSPAPFRWPPERVDADASLSVTPEIQGERNILRRQGPWALFRLFDMGRITRPDATDVVPYTFMVGSRQVALNVTAPATRNPFARDILSDFRCPEL